MDFFSRAGEAPADLSGIWEFTFCPEQIEDIAIADLKFDSFAAVPGCFDLMLRCFCKRGTGIYRRKIECGGNMELVSEGIGLRGVFFWDGKKIGEAEVPFSTEKFFFDAGACGEHELVIAVNNEFDDSPSSFFRRNYDFYAHGGIFRKITLTPAKPLRLEMLQVIPAVPEKGEVEILCVLRGDTEENMTAALFWDGRPSSDILTLKNGEGKGVFHVPDPRIWSPENPELHKLTVKVKDQEFTATFGLRSISIAEGKLFLNGKELKIAGINRHDAHPDFGYAVPEEIRLRDLLMLKEQGFNCIRGCHYPQCESFLALCDRIGMMVWEESLGWENDTTQFADSLFCERQLRETEKMVRKSINHPSVIIWGFLNECSSHREPSRVLIGKLAAMVRKADPSRPVTFGTMFGTRDLCLDLVDIISFNTYPGWYGGTQEQYFDRESLNEELQKLADFASAPEYKDKALIVSEIGAEAFPGDHSGIRWSEEYQSELLCEAMRHIFASERYSGVFLWQFSDCRAYIDNTCQNRPGGFNCKGIVDGSRRPKIAFKEIGKTIRECVLDLKNKK